MNNIKNILMLVVIAYLQVSAENIDVKLREGSSVNLVKGSRTTSTPYGYFVDSFSKSSMKGFDQVDLSAYPNKKLLVGYGVFDINNDNCRYLDVPSNSSFNIDFENIKVIRDQTFAVSREKKTYSQCLALASQYSGFVYTPRNATEYASVSEATKTRNRPIWLGYTRKDCTEPYLNDEGIEQKFSNFSNPNQVCSPSFLNTYTKANTSYWSRSDGSGENYCVVKIASPDYLRPIKFCMPWWRVERTWKVDRDDEVMEYNGKKYDYKYMHYMVDYPKDKVVCLENNVTAAPKPGRYEHSCESYDSYFESPACRTDITLPICHVNRCKGLIQNTCIKKDSYSPSPKDYAISYVQDENGAQKKIKSKANIEINIYDCPVATVTSASCVRKGLVSVFPFECPGSKCDELRECLRDSNRTSDDCLEEFPCEKNYGSVDSPQMTDGKITGLWGICKDGVSRGVAKAEIKSTKKQVCEEYNMVRNTVLSNKNCISIASNSQKTVSTAITDDDLYQDDNRCIRTNNLEEARVDVSAVFEYEVKNYFETSIIKAGIDGEDEVTPTGSTSALLEYYSKLKLQKFDNTADRVVSGDLAADEASCEALVPYSLQEQRLQTMYDGSSTFQGNLKGYLKTTSTPNVTKCPSGYSNVNSRCERDAPACTGTYIDSNSTCESGEFLCSGDLRDSNVCYRNLYYSYPIIGVASGSCTSVSSVSGLPVADKNIMFEDYDFSELGINSEAELDNYCFVGGSLKTGDIFSFVKSNGIKNVEFSTTDSISSAKCDEIARCTSSDVVSNSGHCVLNANELSAPTEEPSNMEDYNPTDLILPVGKGTKTASFNGYTDVFSIQEYAEGEFGYYSNYVSASPEENIVKIGDREVFPIENIEPIKEELNYHFDVKTTTQVTKNEQPDSYSGYARGYSLVPTSTAGFDFEYSGFNGFTTYMAENDVASVFLAIYTVGVSEIVMLFGDKVKYGWYKSHYQIDKPLSSRWVENLYGNDPRVRLPESNIVLYDQKQMFTGTLKKNDFIKMRNNLKTQKNSYLQRGGYSSDDIIKMTRSDAETWNPEWDTDGIKWYHRRRTKTLNKASVGSFAVHKETKNIYLGAVNSMSIVVPYVGDYEVVAYDKAENVLGRVVIEKESFVANMATSNGNVAQEYALVQFGLADSFNIASGQDGQKTSGSCLASDYVEWGGGVSGVYYEQGVPDFAVGSRLCNKSNDTYVLNHSAVKVTVRSLDSNKAFTIKLVKPMPFANKIKLVNLMHLENRKYECWSELTECNLGEQ